MIRFSKCIFQFNSVILNKMQSFHTCTKINDKNPKDSMPTMQNVFFCCIFNIKEWKWKDWTTAWYKNSMVCKQRQTKDIKKKTPIQRCKDNQWKGWWERKPIENSTKERFPITLQALNSHNRDLRRLNNHQNLPKKHQTQQPSIQEWCTRSFEIKLHGYASYRMTTRVCTWLSGKNPCICIETLLG